MDLKLLFDGVLTLRSGKIVIICANSCYILSALDQNVLSAYVNVKDKICSLLTNPTAQSTGSQVRHHSFVGLKMKYFLQSSFTFQ